MVSKHMVNTLSAGGRVDSSVLEIFRTLSEGNESARSSATRILVSHLQSQQEGEDTVCQDLTYSIQRLIKGLSSNRKWARLGFSVAFTQVLRVFDVISVQSVLDGIEKHLVITQHDSKNEVGAVYMGKAFGYLALIQSGKLLTGEERLVAEVVQKLRHISSQKSYLQPICCHGLACLIAKVSSNVFTEHMWRHLEEDLTHGWDDCSPSTLMLVYSAAKTHKKKVNKHFLTEHWGGPKLLGEKNYASLHKVLLKSAEGHPVVHPIVDVVVEDLAATGRDVKTFFDKVVVKLLEGTYSQKYLGLNIYLKMIPTITDTRQLTSTLSPTVMNLLLFHLPRSDSVAHTVCRHIANSLVSKTGNGDKAMDLSILQSFTQTPGRLNFDTVTKTHTVSTLLHKVCEEAVMDYGDSLMAFVDDTDSRYTPDTKKHAISQFCSLLTSPHLQDRQWRLKVLQFLLARTFFNVTCADNSLPQCHMVQSVLYPTIRQCLRANFYKALNALATFHHEKCSRADHFQWYVDLVYELLKYADTLVNSPGTVAIQLETGLQEEILEKWGEVVKISTQIDKKRKKEKKISHHDAFLMLFMYVGLVLLSEPEHVINVLEDLTVCYEKASQKKKLKQDDEPAWIEVVTEMLVSLMSQRSNLTRVIANTVFSALQAHLTQESLAIVISAVQPNKTSDEQEDMLTFEEDVPEEMETDSVTEETTTTTDDTNENEEESESDDEEEEEDAVEDPGLVVDEAMRETVKAALGKAAVNETIADSEEEESESDLSDSEMMKLDAKLAEVFRSMKKGSSKEEKEKKKEILLFRSRVLDLVETVVKNPLAASHAMDLLEVLLQLMEAGHRRKEEKQLGDRALGIFRRLVKKQKEIITDDSFEKTSAFVMLENLIQYSRKANSQDLVRAVSDACLVTVRFLIHQKLDAPPSRITRSKSKPKSSDKETEYLERVLDMVRSALSDFLYRRDHRLHMVFFHNMMQKHPMMFWPLTDILLQSLGDDKVKVHSKTQACALLSALFRCGKQLPEDLGEEHWGPFSTQLSKTLHKLLLGLSANNIKPKYTLELLRVVARLFVIHPDTASKTVNNEVTEKLESIKSHLGKDTRCECNKILNMTSPKSGKKKKQKKKQNKINGRQNESMVEEMADLALTNGTGGGNSSGKPMSDGGESPQKRKSSSDSEPSSDKSSPRKRKSSESEQSPGKSSPHKRKSSDEDVTVSAKKHKKKKVHKNK